MRFKREGKDWWKASESRMPVMRIPVGVIDTLRNQSLHVGEVLPGFRVLLHLADGMGEVTVTVGTHLGRIDIRNLEVRMAPPLSPIIEVPTGASDEWTRQAAGN